MCRIADLPMGNARGPKVRENSARPSTRLATGKEPGQWRATARASPAKASHPANALAAIDQVAGKSMSMAHGEHRRPHGHDDASTSALSSPEHVISYSIPGPDSPIPISGLNHPISIWIEVSRSRRMNIFVRSTQRFSRGLPRRERRTRSARCYRSDNPRLHNRPPMASVDLNLTDSRKSVRDTPISAFCQITLAFIRVYQI